MKKQPTHSKLIHLLHQVVLHTFSACYASQQPETSVAILKWRGTSKKINRARSARKICFKVPPLTFVLCPSTFVLVPLPLLWIHNTSIWRVVPLSIPPPRSVRGEGTERNLRCNRLGLPRVGRRPIYIHKLSLGLRVVYTLGNTILALCRIAN